jgi:alpha-L-fucosidase
VTKTFEIEKGPFKPTWESLRTYTCPEWFRDAKFGIWAHWGPQCVPMYGDWYARHIYVEGSDQYLHHWRVYGHPSTVGYKDIVPLWKAEKFDPEGLMDLYVEAGAKYFFGQAAHHDNFDNWNSAHNRWNAVKVGPKKNIVKMWQDAAKRRGLPFGLSEHLGATFSWFCLNKGCDKAGPYAGVPYDGNDPAYEDLYLPNGEELKNEKRPWLTKDPWWHERWFRRVKDIIDRHHPDLLYSDSEVPFGEVGLHAIAHLYNTSAKLHGGVNQAVYNQKNRDPEIYPVGVLDIERGGEADIFHNVRDKYKTPKHCVEMLVDIASKNGNLLLNFPQRPDGTLDDECLYILKCMAKWIKVNGEGIYGTRPWKKAQEGPTAPEGGAFKEDARAWTSEDYRFTAKGDKVYAFLLKWPEDGKALIKSFGRNPGPEVVNVNLLGFDGQVKYTQDDAGLHITLPAEQTVDYAHCFRLQVGG